MATYLLDSDAIIDYLVGFAPSVELIRSIHSRGDVLAVCDVVIAEAYSGLRPGDRGRAAVLLDSLLYLTTTADAARQGGEWRYTFAREGISLATSDVLVAATARAHQAAIVTGNGAHYPMPDVNLVPLPRRGGL